MPNQPAIDVMDVLKFDRRRLDALVASPALCGEHNPLRPDPDIDPVT
jgi:hypothetical protein